MENVYMLKVTPTSFEKQDENTLEKVYAKLSLNSIDDWDNIIKCYGEAIEIIIYTKPRYKHSNYKFDISYNHHSINKNFDSISIFKDVNNNIIYSAVQTYLDFYGVYYREDWPEIAETVLSEKNVRIRTKDNNDIYCGVNSYLSDTYILNFAGNINDMQTIKDDDTISFDYHYDCEKIANNNTTTEKLPRVKTQEQNDCYIVSW